MLYLKLHPNEEITGQLHTYRSSVLRRGTGQIKSGIITTQMSFRTMGKGETKKIEKRVMKKV